MIRFFGAILVAIWTLIGPASAQSLLVPSTWQNQRGSVLRALNGNPASQTFSGVYINNAPGFQCRGTPYDLTGRTRGTLIVFRVVWKNSAADCHSATVWRGHVSAQTLVTTWVLKTQSGRVLRGTDTFLLQ